MLRFLFVGILVIVLVATVAYTAAINGSARLLGAGTATVPHISATCQITRSTNTLQGASDTIGTLTVTVNCSTTGTYVVQSVVASGAASSTNSVTVSLTANTATEVTIDVNLDVSTAGPKAYSITYTVTLQ